MKRWGIRRTACSGLNEASWCQWMTPFDFTYFSQTYSVNLCSNIKKSFSQTLLWAGPPCYCLFSCLSSKHLLLLFCCTFSPPPFLSKITTSYFLYSLFCYMKYPYMFLLSALWKDCILRILDLFTWLKQTAGLWILGNSTSEKKQQTVVSEELPALFNSIYNWLWQTFPFFF